MSFERHGTDRGVFVIVKGELDDEVVAYLRAACERHRVVEVDLNEAGDIDDEHRQALDALRERGALHVLGRRW